MRGDQALASEKDQKNQKVALLTLRKSRTSLWLITPLRQVNISAVIGKPFKNYVALGRNRGAVK